jgi:hypothetical protein
MQNLNKTETGKAIQLILMSSGRASPFIEIKNMNGKKLPRSDTSNVEG